MKSRTLLFTLIGLVALAIGALWFYLSTNKQENLTVFPATVNRDCAPWDGAAFTVSISYTPGTMIYISIWQSPDIKFPTTFTLPDETGQIGHAYILPELDPLEQLSGKVFFHGFEQGKPVTGSFDLLTETGQRFKGQFEVQWGDFVAYCG